MLKITTKSGTVYYTKELKTKKFFIFWYLVDESGIHLFPTDIIESITEGKANE